MASGKVKWFDNKKVSVSLLRTREGRVCPPHLDPGNGYKTLKEGETVQFDLIDSDKGPKPRTSSGRSSSRLGWSAERRR